MKKKFLSVLFVMFVLLCAAGIIEGAMVFGGAVVALLSGGVPELVRGLIEVWPHALFAALMFLTIWLEVQWREGRARSKS